MQLIETQLGLSSQKSCVYRMKKCPSTNTNADESSHLNFHVSHYFQVRVKSLEYGGQDAVAIFFHDQTQHFKGVKSEQELQQANAECAALRKSRMATANEQKTPLQTTLMLLESILSQVNMPEWATQSFWLVVHLVNLLLCSANDNLDLTVIEEGKFIPISEKFQPKAIFTFVLDIFAPWLRMQSNTLKFEAVSRLRCPNDESMLLAEADDSTVPAELPGVLTGDHLRLKQVLINLVKNTLKYVNEGLIRVRAAFDPQKELLVVHLVDSGRQTLNHRSHEMATALTQILKKETCDYSDPLQMSLYTCKRILESSGGALNLLPRNDGYLATVVFSISMKPASQAADGSAGLAQGVNSPERAKHASQLLAPPPARQLGLSAPDSQQSQRQANKANSNGEQTQRDIVEEVRVAP